jgi:hypothetical protein
VIRYLSWTVEAVPTHPLKDRWRFWRRQGKRKRMKREKKRKEKKKREEEE